MNVTFERKAIILGFLFLIVFGLLYHSHRSNIQIIKGAQLLQKDLVEQNVLVSLKYADASYKIIESIENANMERYSQVMVDRYYANSSVASWDLEELKLLFANYDIYIVDENLKIIHTTFAPDLGLDFTPYPYFARLLRQRLAGDRFSADRIDISTTSGRVKKYSYMPTPDNKYLLELSVDIAQQYPAMEELNVFSHAKTLAADYDLVDNISFYKVSEDASSVGLVTDEGGYITTDIAPETEEAVRVAVLSGTPVTADTHSPNGERTIKFVPYLTYDDLGETNWWSSYVVAVTYDNTAMHADITKANTMFAGQLLLTSLVFGLFAYLINRLLSRTELLASRDPLTHLPNRNQFEDHFAKVSKQMDEKANGCQAALLFIDLDSFKEINDSYGHKFGDQLLRAIATILRENLGKDDMVTRVGGDEFAIFLANLPSEDHVFQSVTEIGDLLNKPLILMGQEVPVRASIGVSIYPDHGLTADELIHKADTAMYQAKQQKDLQAVGIRYYEV